MKPLETDDQHFKRTSLFVFTTVGLVLLYVFLITFIPIPEKNQRFVDISLAFLLGWISSNSSYLTGGNPQQAQRKPSLPAPGTTTADISATITTDNSETPAT